MSHKMKAVVLLMIMLPMLGAWADSPFQRDYENWRGKREQALRAPDGWLTLAGLFWLHQGDNRFGSAADNEVRFPSGPEHLGTLHLAADGTVVATVLPGQGVTVGGKPTSEVTYPAHGEEGAQKMAVGTLSWYVIERDGQRAIRLKDSASKTLADFHGIERFAPDERWRRDAVFVAVPPGKVRRVPTAQGTMNDMPLAGMVKFDIEKTTYQLEAYTEEGTDELFIIFGDASNGHETYPAGRYLYAPKPDADNRTVVDFNRAYNPPCAFTHFATCSIPTAQNRLPIAVLAGEKRTH